MDQFATFPPFSKVEKNMAQETVRIVKWLKNCAVSETFGQSVDTCKMIILIKIERLRAIPVPHLIFFWAESNLFNNRSRVKFHFSCTRVWKNKLKRACAACFLVNLMSGIQSWQTDNSFDIGFRYNYPGFRSISFLPCRLCRYTVYTCNQKIWILCIFATELQFLKAFIDIKLRKNFRRF